MPQPNDRQQDFARALLDPGQPVPPGLVGPDGQPSARRFAVYRNNVAVGLIDALKAAFPAVHRIVGDEFFIAMARTYALADPPRSPILLGYGQGFPDFIAGFAPASTLPYLADVARIERAWTEAYHAPEAEPLDRAVFMPTRVAQRNLVLHPSLRLVRSDYPALTIWSMNIGKGVPAPVDLATGGEAVLIVRPRAEVEVRSIPPACAPFIEALMLGRSIQDAVTPGFDPAPVLGGLFAADAIVGLR